MKKIKELFKGSSIAMVVAGLVVAGVASAALITIYGSTTGSATNVKQSVLFGDNSTTKTYKVGNSDPVAGNIYYDLVTLKNDASDKSATVQLNTTYQSPEHPTWWSPTEAGIDTSYMRWATPEKVLTGVRPTVVYNSYDGTGYQNYKKYEMWYKTDEHATNLHYAYYHYQNGSWKWDGGDTNVAGTNDCPFVMKENGKYYMVNYGPTNHKDFYIYKSDNGVNWTMTNLPIYTETRGDLEKVDNPKILKDENGYKMYFQGKTTETTDPKYYIFLATSDAKNMKEIAGGDKSFVAANGGSSVLQPGAEGEWDSFRVMQPIVFKSGNKGYTMLYTGYDKYDTTGMIGYATSSNGIAWGKIKVSKEGYDTNLGTGVHKASVVKTNNNLVLFYQNGDKIDWTWLAPINNPMTLQSQEIKPFFIKNDFAINLKPMNYMIKTNVIPVVTPE